MRNTWLAETHLWKVNCSASFYLIAYQVFPLVSFHTLKEVLRNKYITHNLWKTIKQKTKEHSFQNKHVSKIKKIIYSSFNYFKAIEIQMKAMHAKFGIEEMTSASGEDKGDSGSLQYVETPRKPQWHAASQNAGSLWKDKLSPEHGNFNFPENKGKKGKANISFTFHTGNLFEIKNLELMAVLGLMSLINLATVDTDL